MSEARYNITIHFDGSKSKEITGFEDYVSKDGDNAICLYLGNGKRVVINWAKVTYYILTDLRTSKEQYVDNKKRRWIND